MTSTWGGCTRHCTGCRECLPPGYWWGVAVESALLVGVILAAWLMLVLVVG